MNIKVCGMREAENIRHIEALGIDMMGFIFWPESSRYVCSPPHYLPTKCKRVGAFVDASIEAGIQHSLDYQLDIIQLHGHETPAFAHQLSQWTTIKVFNIATSDDLIQTKAYEGSVDFFLFDTKGKSIGGNGEKFDWSVLDAYKGRTPFLLSGGIGPEDAERVKAFRHPRCMGIDLNSRFETAPGLKDVNQLKEFIQQIRL